MQKTAEKKFFHLISRTRVSQPVALYPREACHRDRTFRKTNESARVARASSICPSEKIIVGPSNSSSYYLHRAAESVSSRRKLSTWCRERAIVRAEWLTIRARSSRGESHVDALQILVPIAERPCFGRNFFFYTCCGGARSWSAGGSIPAGDLVGSVLALLGIDLIDLMSVKDWQG